MQRRCVLLTAVLFSVFGVIRAEAVEPPNVLFIAIDDLRPEVGCYVLLCWMNDRGRRRYLGRRARRKRIASAETHRPQHDCLNLGTIGIEIRDF